MITEIEITINRPKRPINFDLENNSVNIGCNDESILEYIGNLSESNTDEFFDGLVLLMRKLKEQKANDKKFKVAMRLDGLHFKFEVVISFLSKRSVFVLIERMESVNIDSYLDYLNEIKHGI